MSIGGGGFLAPVWAPAKAVPVITKHSSQAVAASNDEVLNLKFTAFLHTSGSIVVTLARFAWNAASDPIRTAHRFRETAGLPSRTADPCILRT